MQGDVVVITGAFGQLGTAVRHAAAARGARLALIDTPLPQARALIRAATD